MKKLLAILLGGTLFGYGLALSGMTKPEIVLSFLQLKDLGLLFVMGGAVLITMPTYTFTAKIFLTPLLAGNYETYKATLNKKTITGATLFGLGWGISGLCPGSALASIGIGNYPILIGIGTMFLGAYVQGKYLK